MGSWTAQRCQATRIPGEPLSTPRTSGCGLLCQASRACSRLALVNLPDNMPSPGTREDQSCPRMKCVLTWPPASCAHNVTCAYSPVALELGSPQPLASRRWTTHRRRPPSRQTRVRVAHFFLSKFYKTITICYLVSKNYNF